MTLASLLHAKNSQRISLFLISLSALAWEVLLTRIYSVMFYYHFAFLVVSIGMFGFTAGALLCLLFPKAFLTSKLNDRMANLALLTGILMVVSILIQLAPPHSARDLDEFSYPLIQAYFLSSLPFIPAGALICLFLTRYENVGSLYACDLVGAGFGALVLPILLECFGGPGSVFFIAALCLLAAGFLHEKRPYLRRLVFLLAIALAAFSGLNSRVQWVRLRWRHDGLLPVPLYEKWNAFSRIMVTPFPPSRAFTWAADPALISQWPVPEQLMLQIDAGAGTPITHYQGDLKPLGYLRDDLTAMAHYLRPKGHALVIGAGGGRDVLTALLFGHDRVTAVEVNGAIAHAVQGVYGDFSGHLDHDPRVHAVIDEGRHFVEQSRDRYQVIQASLVDSAAATAAGAYSFVENSLYTREAWTLFLRHLEPEGVLTFSRWYKGFSAMPVEMYRTVRLAAESLRDFGIQNPAGHILVIRGQPYRGSTERLATLLVSPNPFTPKDLDVIHQVCRDLHFEVVYDPTFSIDPFFRTLIDDASRTSEQQFPSDISAPTDDRPFFFFHTKLSQVLQNLLSNPWSADAFEEPAMHILWTLLRLTIILGLLLVALPIPWLVKQHQWTPRFETAHWLFLSYFGAIGLGFMFVEVALIQRLSLYLGHPTYGFTVSLTGLLIFSGIGSLLYASRARLRGPLGFRILLPLLGVVILLMEWATRAGLAHSLGHSNGERIMLSLLVIAPLATLMGAGFPMAMTIANSFQDSLTSWYWAINGAASVMGSVMAVSVSFLVGLQATFFVGALCYLMAAWIYLRLSTRIPT